MVTTHNEKSTIETMTKTSDDTRDVFAVRIENDYIGFFACVLWALEVLVYCEQHKLKPYFEFAGANYLQRERGANWFDYFFELKHTISDDEVKRAEMRVITSPEQLGFQKDYNRELDFALANKLFDKYFAIKPHVLEKVERFANEHFGAGEVLGVHYRGTDKIIEASRVGYEDVTGKIKRFLAAHPNYKTVFLASDETPFIEYLTQNLRGVRVVANEDVLRVATNRPDETPVHKQWGVDNYLKGEEALVNCLLLARCATIIKTASLLSAWAKIFNTHQKIIMLNLPTYDWFPERDIVREQSLMDVWRFNHDGKLYFKTQVKRLLRKKG